MSTNLLFRLLPKSLVGRVYALYAFTLLVFVGGSVALFYQYQFVVKLGDAKERAGTLMAVVGPAIADSAVIGDYDTIRRTLRRAVNHSDFSYAAFIDQAGGEIFETPSQHSSVLPPKWLRDQMAGRLYDINSSIVVGGRAYGVLRLSFSAEGIAGDLWQQARIVIGLALASLLGGLLLIRLPLVSWLGELGQVSAYDAAMQTGVPALKNATSAATVTEFRETFLVLDRAAATLQAQREQATATLGAIGDGVITLDANEKVLLANPVACAMLAMSAQSLLGQSIRSLCPDIFLDTGPLKPWRDRRSTVHKKNRAAMVIETTLSPIWGLAEQAVGYVLACRDITAKHALDQQLQHELASRQSTLLSLRQILEGLMPQAGPDTSSATLNDLDTVSQLISSLVAQLQERNDQLSAIFELSPDGFVSFDSNRQVKYTSPSFARLTGLPGTLVQGLYESEFMARLAEQCTAESGWRNFTQLRQLAPVNAKEKAKREFIHIEKPSKRVLEVRLKESQSEAISQVFYLRDVTHETEVDQLKSEFLSTAAHELRTPMANIYGYSELMINRTLPPEQQKEFIQIIYRQTEQMISIINELLDLERIEARQGKDFLLENADLASVVRAIANEFNPPQNRPAPLITAPTSCMGVRLDRSKMNQALSNVLSNAYKYSPSGAPVQIRFLSRINGAGQTQVGVEVQDGGLGMSPEQLSRVSERFYRADASGSIPGTGLGMSIVKEIIEFMGGSLELFSTFGVGTQATLWLPYAAAAATAVETAPVHVAPPV